MKKLKKNDLIKAERILNTFKFIDDLNSIMIVGNLQLMTVVSILSNES